jgi:hypothetical protein
MTQSANQPAVRRGLMGTLLALGASGLSSATSGPGAEPLAADAGNRVWGTEAQARQRLREQRTPNVPLVDQDGRSLRFYDDVMQDRRVIISVMYSVCSNTCTPSTRNLIEARRLLGDEARDLHFVSLSLTPLKNSGAGYTSPASVGGTNSASVTRTVELPIEEFTGQIYVRLRGRQMVMKMQSTALGVAWQMASKYGPVLLHLTKLGQSQYRYRQQFLTSYKKYWQHRCLARPINWHHHSMSTPA